MVLEPAICGPPVRFINLVEQRIKALAMIHMSEMRHFMCNHRPADMDRGHDQPPAQSDRLLTGTAAPASPRISDGQFWQICPGPRAIILQVFCKNGSGLCLEPAQNARLDMLTRTAQSDFAFPQQGRTSKRRGPANDMWLPQKRDLAAIRYRYRGQGFGKASVEPFGFGPGKSERLTFRREHRHGQADNPLDRICRNYDRPSLLRSSQMERIAYTAQADRQRFGTCSTKAEHRGYVVRAARLSIRE